ncbi:MAG: glycosyltransferase family 2 protein [Acidobacteria bacterium]|nr:glycosyltransferase family 2 protein [Acidobacteriota bacterium]
MPSDNCAPHPSLSIVVPLYNEEANIETLIKAIFAVFSTDANFLELILVDDGSHDHTAALARQAIACDSRIRLLSHTENRGLGAAIRTGLAAAEGELVLYTDADLPFDFQLIPQLLARATDNNIVIGYRANRGEGLRRWVLTKGYHLLCYCAFRLRVRDINFACKLLPRRALSRMKLHSEGSFIDAEMLLEGQRQGFEITEFPLTYYPRVCGISTLSRPAVVVGILKEMLRYAGRKNQTSYELVEETDPKRG